MKTLKSNSSPTSNCRQPLEPVTRLEQVPIGLYEILDFAMHSEDPLASQIVQLTRSIIEVTQIEASGLADLANLPRVAEIPGIGK